MPSMAWQVPSIWKYLDISHWLMVYFYSHGRFCARHPKKIILGAVCLSLISCIGFLNFNWESRVIKLWIPQDSDFARNYAYLWENYPPDMRFHSLLFATQNEENILEPKYIQQMYSTYKKIMDIRTPTNLTWNDLCLRLPIVKIDVAEIMGIKNTSKRMRRQVDNGFEDFDDTGFDDFEKDSFIKNFDPSVSLYPDPYCGVTERMDTACFVTSILELWANNGKFDEVSDKNIANLKLEDVIERVNGVTTSGLFLIDKDFLSTFGGTKIFDQKGRLLSATSASLQLIGKMNTTLALEEGVSFDDALGELVDSQTSSYEVQLISVLLEEAQMLKSEGTNLYINVARSFGDISNNAIITDIGLIVIGFSIVFTYVSLVLGKMSMIQNRMFLSAMGLVSCALAIGSSYGLCSLFGFEFSPMHNFIPFLILGLGIDDMFVIIQTWNNLEKEEKCAKKKEALNKDAIEGIRQSCTLKRTQEELEIMAGKCMEHSGVSISVTSLTDLLAFAVGATTVLPALRSFCIFCGVGILIVYLLQASWFMAWLVIDEHRQEDGRNGFLPCIKHNLDPTNKSVKSKFNGFDQMKVIQDAFVSYSNFIMKTPVKIFVIMSTVGLFSIGLWGNTLLVQKFDAMLFLPLDSYLVSWHNANEQHFPENGEKIFVFVTDLQLPEELDKLDEVLQELREQGDILHSIKSWYLDFKEYHKDYFEEKDGVKVTKLSKEAYQERLTRFLFSPKGSQYRMLFRFDKPIKCGIPAPEAEMFTMEFTHNLFSGPSEQVPAMNRVKRIIEAANFTGGSGRVFPFSRGYAAWETDEVISEELYRNLALAFCCIFVTTLLLLSDFYACIQVLSCVVLTMVNTAGIMHFWGLTIETVSCTNLIICIGICVDSAAHITHEFLATSGTKEERSKLALKNIGPAVLNGGFSTFLTFIVCANSNSYVFTTFFKIFFLVTIFAMFHGMVFLPVMLSFIGPKHWKSAKIARDQHMSTLPNEDQQAAISMLPINPSKGNMK